MVRFILESLFAISSIFFGMYLAKKRGFDNGVLHEKKRQREEHNKKRLWRRQQNVSGRITNSLQEIGSYTTVPYGKVYGDGREAHMIRIFKWINAEPIELVSIEIACLGNGDIIELKLINPDSEKTLHEYFTDFSDDSLVEVTRMARKHISMVT